jgi:hypothetical protein
MVLTKIRITNEILWQHESVGENIDTWLINNIGKGNWTEHLSYINVPYRSFSFKEERHATLFVLKWT